LVTSRMWLSRVETRRSTGILICVTSFRTHSLCAKFIAVSTRPVSSPAEGAEDLEAVCFKDGPFDCNPPAPRDWTPKCHPGYSGAGASTSESWYPRRVSGLKRRGCPVEPKKSAPQAPSEQRGRIYNACDKSRSHYDRTANRYCYLSLSARPRLINRLALTIHATPHQLCRESAHEPDHEGDLSQEVGRKVCDCAECKRPRLIRLPLWKAA
jgi:hypothetical protein